MGFKLNTAFVVGAGAHADYGMPTAADLVRKLGVYSSAMRGAYCDEAPEVLGALGAVCRPSDTKDYTRPGIWHGGCVDGGPYVDFMRGVEALHRRMCESRHGSIDSLLARMDDRNRQLGKWCIAALLHHAEHAVIMKRERIVGWSRCFAEVCAHNEHGCGLHSPNVFENTRIITFNYDRLDEIDIRTMLRNEGLCTGNLPDPPPIFHVHGVLWGEAEWSIDRRVFVPRIGPESVLNSERQMRLVGEHPNAPDVSKAVVAALRDAARVVFLGFGFNEQNLARIGLHERLNDWGLRELAPNAVFYATNYGGDAGQIQRAQIAFGRRRITWGERGQSCYDCLKSWNIE